MLIVHDYVTQRGGAERVALELLRAFPGSRLLTSIYAPEQTYPDFADFEVDVLPLSRVPAFRADPRRALPFLAPAFSSVRVAEEIVVCSSSGWAHGVRNTGQKIVYCHNPARWLYQTGDYLRDQPAWVGAALRTAKPALLRWDRAAAAHPRTTYLANSTVVRERIRRAYGVDAQVVPPPVAVSAAGPQRACPGLEPGFLLTVGRARGYKNTGAVCDAMALLPDLHLVVVGGDLDDVPERVTCLPRVSEEELRWLYANCSMLVVVGHEDFGLTPLEANAFGRPVLALRAGGYLDTVVEGRNGTYVDSSDPVTLAAGIRRCQGQAFDAVTIRTHAAAFAPEVFAGRLRDVVDGALVSA